MNIVGWIQRKIASPAQPTPDELSRREFLRGGFLRGVLPAPPTATGNSASAKLPLVGPVRISPFDCLAHQGTTCSACRERCPVPGAIVLTGQRPQIDPALCTDCGICHDVCPAPRNAVLIMPHLRRKATS